MKFILFIFLVIILVACNSNKAGETTEKKDNASQAPTVFFYYPKPNVYLDTTTKAFTYYDSASREWKTGNLPAALYADLGKSALITDAAQPVWTDNKQHRLVYSAALYADSSDFKRDEAKTTKTKKKPPETAETKKKNKIGQFFRKIFGKKKDKDQ